MGGGGSAQHSQMQTPPWMQPPPLWCRPPSPECRPPPDVDPPDADPPDADPPQCRPPPGRTSMDAEPPLEADLPLWTECHTGVKTLPCPKLRLRAVTILTRKNVKLQITLKTLIQLISWRIHIGLLQIHQRQRTSNTILAAKNHTLTLHLTWVLFTCFRVRVQKLFLSSENWVSP